MKKLVSVTAIAVLFLSFFSSNIDAQNGRNFKKGGCWYGGGRNYNNNINMPFYDLKSEVKVNGTMESFDVIRGRGMRGGLEITINDGKDKHTVHVGPTWYLDDINLDINNGDKLEVFGSKIDVKGKTLILASKITQNGKTYSLRDKYGVSKWGRRNRTN